MTEEKGVSELEVTPESEATADVDESENQTLSLREIAEQEVPEVINPLERFNNAVLRATYLEEAKNGWLFALEEGQKALVMREELAEAPEVGAEFTLLVERQVKGYWGASLAKAQALMLWGKLERLARTGERIKGKVVAVNDGGLVVDVGVRGFVPRRQIDLHDVEDLAGFVGREEEFAIVKFDPRDANLILSRRSILEAGQAENRDAFVAGLEVGQTHHGVVRRVMPYGLFVDIGCGVEGLVHRSNLSWSRAQPAEMFKPGDTLKVQIIEYDAEKGKIGLGHKQVLDDPWQAEVDKLQVGALTTGKVITLANFGAFVELAPGVEGMVHNSEISWTERVTHPRQALKLGQEVEVKIIAIEVEERRIKLSIKQVAENPWLKLAERVKIGEKLMTKVARIADFGVFVTLEEGLDGLIHASDIAWGERVDKLGERFSKGQEVEAVLLEIDPEAGKAALGIKQLTEDPWEAARKVAKPGTRLEVTVKRLAKFGAFVELMPGIEGLIHISELSDERVQEVSEVVQIGQSLDAVVQTFDKEKRRIGLSLKAQPFEAEDFDASYQPAEEARTTLGDLMPEGLRSKGSASEEG